MLFARAQAQAELQKTLDPARNRLWPSEENLCHFIRIPVSISTIWVKLCRSASL